MARMHSRKKGKSGSTRPPVATKAEWVELNERDIENLVVKLAKEGKSPSAIGLELRDSYGVPLVKPITGKSILQILKENKLAPEFPEDMLSLIKKAVFLRKHLDRNPRDIHNRHGLLLVESKIKRLQRYYKRKKVLPNDWYYNAEEASLLVK